MFLFLYGDDSYRSGQKLNEIKAKFKEKTDPSGVNIVVFNGEDFNLEKFNNASSQSGFLVAKRLIITKNLLAAKPKKELTEQLIELLKKLKASENIYVFREDSAPDKRTSLFKLLTQDKKSAQEFKALEYKQLEDWLKKYLNQAGTKMSPAGQ